MMDRLKAMASSVRRFIEGTPQVTVVDASRLIEDIADLLSATGILSEALWERAARDAEEDLPSGIRAVALFRKASQAENPLDEKVCNTAMRALLNAQVRRRWGSRHHHGAHESLAGLGWSDLTDFERVDVRDTIQELCVFADKSGTRGRRRQADLDTVLFGLAEIYWRHFEAPKLSNEREVDNGGQLSEAGTARRHPTNFSDAETSRFVKFLLAVLTPCAPVESVTPKALSRRWKRVKKLKLEGIISKK